MQIATVKSEDLNLRAGPGADAKVIDQLTAGDRLQLERSSGRWHYGRVVHTRTGIGVNQYGWVHAAYVAVATVPDPADPRPPGSSIWAWLAGLAAAAIMALWVWLGWS